MPTQMTQNQVNTPVDIGPVLQVPLTAQQIGLATSIPASSEVSTLLQTAGYKRFSIGVQSTQDGVLTIERFMDQEGIISQDNDTDYTAPIVADELVNINLTDDKPFQSIKITVSNSSGSTATLSPFLVLLQAN